MNLARRHFIKLAGAAAASLIAPSLSSARPRPISAAAWRSLATKVTGGVLRPGARGFAALTRRQNLRYDGSIPLAVARPRDAAETCAAIPWARAHDIPWVPRSG